MTPDRSARSLLFFAALYHDAAKPAAKSVDPGGRAHFLGHEVQGAEVAAKRGQALRLSNEEVDYASFMVRHHMRFPELAHRMELQRELPSRRAIYRFFRDAGPRGVDLVLMGLADLRGSRGTAMTDRAWTAFLETARLLLENYWEKPQESVAPPRLVDGVQVMQAYGLQPGRIVGRVLQAIQQAQAEGSVSSREEAIEFGRTWLKSREH